MVAPENEVNLGMQCLIRQALGYKLWCNPEAGPAQQCWFRSYLKYAANLLSHGSKENLLLKVSPINQ